MLYALLFNKNINYIMLVNVYWEENKIERNLRK